MKLVAAARDSAAKQVGGCMVVVVVVITRACWVKGMGIDLCLVLYDDACMMVAGCLWSDVS